MEAADTLVFYVNGKKITDARPDTEATLLQYLRRKLLLPGTKEGCGHGGCGSCTVMVSKYCHVDKHISVNACLFPLCSAHGLAFTTVEGVGSPSTGLHDVQKRLVASHGLQCGYCTPGFVMSAFTLLRNNPRPTRDDVERALEGNLCRCTGYRPILDALDTFTQEGCPMGDQCCKKQGDTSADQPTDTVSPSGDMDSTQVPIFPAELQLSDGYHTKSVTFAGDRWTWIRPVNLPELLVLKNRFPSAPVIMGNTTAALHIKLGKFDGSPVLLYGGGVPALKEVTASDAGVVLGAGLTMSEVADKLKLLKIYDESKQKHIESVLEMIREYGADQIRNVATLSGSLLCGRSNSDVLVLLMSLYARVTLASVAGERTVLLDGLQLRDGEVLKSVTIPYSCDKSYSAFYKQSDRRTFSLALINSGMSLELGENNKVAQLRLCFGGVNKQPMLAMNAMSFALGKSWDETTRERIINTLRTELLVDNGKAADKYKAEVAVAFFLRFFATVRAQLTRSTEDDPILSRVPLGPASSTVYYDPCVDPDQSEDDALGWPVPNVSSEVIVSGEAVYIDDMPKLDGELFMSFVLSRRPHAKIVSVDPSEALKLPGVHRYIDHRDIIGENKYMIFHSEEIFASKEVHAVGQTIGGILADTRELARKASFLVNVQYEDLPAIFTIEEAIKADSYLGEKLVRTDGDVEKGFRESDHILEGEYRTGFQEHFYLEPQVTLAIPKMESNEIDIYAATQNADHIAVSVKQAICVSQNRINVKYRRLGGGFGGKGPKSMIIAVPTAIAAHTVKRPVRCVLPREVDMEMTGKRHPFLGRYKVGVTNDGKMKALDVKMYNNGGFAKDVSVDVMSVAVDHFDNAYKLENLLLEGYACRTNTGSNTAFRGFGAPQAALIMEDIMFKIANQLNRPLEQVMEVNMYKEGDVTHMRHKLDNCTLSDLWKRCEEQSNFKQRLEEVKKFNSDNRWKKRGIVMSPGKSGIGYPVAFLYRGKALVNIYRDGTVLVTHSGAEMGQGLNTKVIQIASHALGLPVDMIYTSETGSHILSNPNMTGGNMGTALYGNAVLDACNILMKRLEPLRQQHPDLTCILYSGCLQHTYEAPADACNILMKRLEPLRQQHPDLTWEKLIGKAIFNGLEMSAIGSCRNAFSKNKSYDYTKYTGNLCEHYAYCMICTEVEIDVLTGENQVLQADIVFDVGKSLNPAIDVGQIEGGFVQGLGLVTSEEIILDKDGRITNPSPLSYKIPNVRSIPRKFNVTLMKNHNIVTSTYSAKGIGEPPLLLAMSVVSAIKEAVKAARQQIGIHGYFRLDCPATVERIQTVCGDQLKVKA